jgi:hypothetical protein
MRAINDINNKLIYFKNLYLKILDYPHIIGK